MGKKNKNRPAPVTPSVDYDAIPEDQRKSWILSDNLGVLKDYFSLLDWIREWGSKDGFICGGIQSLGFIRGYPFIEVSVSTPEIPEKKFLISRSSLYILAFHSATHGWLVFDDPEFKIKLSGKSRVLERSPRYSTEPWECLGPHAMIKALKMMDSNRKVAAEGCEIFMVHLCEASRFRLFQVTIGRTLIPVSSYDASVDDDNDELKKKKAGTRKCIDILDRLAPIIVDLTKSVGCDGAARHCIKLFKQLSKTWYEYDLSGGELFELDDKIADSCGVSTARTLNRMLCVLCNTNLNKIVEEWRKKVGTTSITKTGFEKMQSRISEIERKGPGTTAAASGSLEEGCDEPPQKRIRVEETAKKKGKKKGGGH